jgi:hypothetical protein
MHRTRGIAIIITLGLALGLVGCSAVDDDASSPVPAESENPGIGASDGLYEGMPAEFNEDDEIVSQSVPDGWPADVPLPENLGYDFTACEGPHCFLASNMLANYDALLAVKNPYLAALRADAGWQELSSLGPHNAFTFVSTSDPTRTLLVRHVMLTNTPGIPARLTLELIWR